MKVTFELPPPLVQRLRFHVPSGERSKFVADLISRKLQNQVNTLERAAQKANTLRKVNHDIHDMKDWEASRLLARAKRGNVKRGLALLDKLDRSFARKRET